MQLNYRGQKHTVTVFEHISRAKKSIYKIKELMSYRNLHRISTETTTFNETPTVKPFFVNSSLTTHVLNYKQKLNQCIMGGEGFMGAFEGKISQSDFFS